MVLNIAGNILKLNWEAYQFTFCNRINVAIVSKRIYLYLRHFENKNHRKYINPKLVGKETITILNETESCYKSKNRNYMKKSVHGSKKDQIERLPNSICVNEKEEKSILDSER